MEGALQSHNVILYNKPASLKLRQANISVELLMVDDETLKLKLCSHDTVFYVLMSTLESGWFDDNAFAMRSDTIKVCTITCLN
jgi:hypothetical protein